MDLCSSNSPERKKKKKTCLEVGEPDRLSELPDSLILHILSFLEMKDVVKTGILSKRWKLLWTQATTIVYHHSDLPSLVGNSTLDKLKEEVMRPFIYFIDRTLLKCVSSIKHFSLDGFWDIYKKDECVINLLDKWIDYVCDKKVEVMEMTFYGLSYSAPNSLYQSSSLTSLKVAQLGISPSCPVNWTSLKRLFLVRICVEDASMDNVLLGCPVLETLVLQDVYGLNHLNIMCPSVKTLKLLCIEYDGSRPESNLDDILEIRAPWLQELEISYMLIVRNFRVVDASSLVKSILTCCPYLHTSEDFFEADGDDGVEFMNLEKEYQHGWILMAANLIKSLCHVGELIIRSQIIQALTSSKLTGITSPTFKCTHLTIDSPLWHYEFPGLAYLLQNAPHLETLVIRVSTEQCLPLSPIEELFPDGEQHLDQAHGNLEHLKTVIVDYHNNFCYNYFTLAGKFCDVEVLIYILRSATALKSLILYSSSLECSRTNCQYPNCTFRYVTRLSSKLTNFLAGNEAVEWELKKRKFTFEYNFSDYASICSAN